MTASPKVQTFFHQPTGTWSYLVSHAGHAAIIDPVLDYDAAAARTGTSSVDAIIRASREAGLELDWICMTWDADLRRANGDWGFHGFRGSRWTTTRKPARQRYLLNAYRVLLTRARQGMVIFVPPGDTEDPTRDPAFYEQTYDFLLSVGIPPIKELLDQPAVLK